MSVNVYILFPLWCVATSTASACELDCANLDTRVILFVQQKCAIPRERLRIECAALYFRFNFKRRASYTDVARRVFGSPSTQIPAKHGQRSWSPSVSRDPHTTQGLLVTLRSCVTLVYVLYYHSCSLVDNYQQFEGTYCVRRPSWRWMQYMSLKRYYPRKRLHGFTIQKVKHIHLNRSEKLWSRTGYVTTSVNLHPLLNQLRTGLRIFTAAAGGSSPH